MSFEEAKQQVKNQVNNIDEKYDKDKPNEDVIEEADIKIMISELKMDREKILGELSTLLKVLKTTKENFSAALKEDEANKNDTEAKTLYDKLKSYINSIQSLTENKGNSGDNNMGGNGMGGNNNGGNGGDNMGGGGTSIPTPAINNGASLLVGADARTNRINTTVGYGTTAKNGNKFSATVTGSTVLPTANSRSNEDNMMKISGSGPNNQEKNTAVAVGLSLNTADNERNRSNESQRTIKENQRNAEVTQKSTEAKQSINAEVAEKLADAKTDLLIREKSNNTRLETLSKQNTFTSLEKEEFKKINREKAKLEQIIKDLEKQLEGKQ